MTSFEIPPRVCPSCRAVLDGATNIEHETSPVDGDVTICLYCAALLVFDGDVLRHPTIDELSPMLDDPRLRVVRRVVLEHISRYGSNPPRTEPG